MIDCETLHIYTACSYDINTKGEKNNIAIVEEQKIDADILTDYLTVAIRINEACNIDLYRIKFITKYEHVYDIVFMDA